MANDNASGGNITLVKNAPRDKNGKRIGRFSQHDHLENSIARKMDFETLGIYSFLLNNAGGNFRCTVKNIIAVSPASELNESKVHRILNKLIRAGWLEKVKIGYDGQHPVYEYHIYEVSPKLQAAEQPAPTTSTQAATFPPAIDTSDFSPAEIEQAISTTAKAPARIASPSLFITADTAEENTSKPEAQSAKVSKKQSGDEYKQHVFNICQSKGAFSQTAKDKVIKCCRKYYTETKQFADDDLIAQFANRFSENSGQAVATVYKQVVAV